MSKASQDQAPEEPAVEASKPESDGSDRPFMGSAIPHEILKQQLDSLDIGFEAGELERACAAAQASLGPAAPGKRCKFIFKELDLRGVRVSQMHWRRFDQRRLPAIVFHDQQWQFAEHAEQGQFRLTSAQGLLTDLSEQDLSSAMVLWIQRLDRERAGREEASFFGNSAAKLVLSEVFKTKRWVREILVASVIVNVLAVCTSLFAMQVYDRVVPTLAYATLYTLVGGMVIVFALSWMLKRVRARILDSLSSEVDRTVSQKVFDHVIHLQLDTRPRSLGTLAAQVGGLDMVRQFFTSGVIFALVDMPFAIMFIVFIAFIGGPVAWVYVLLMPIALILGVYAQSRLHNLMRDQQIRTNERQGMLVDVIQGTESIRSTNSAWRFSEEWKNITSTIVGYNVQQKALSSFATNTTGTIASAAYICALVVGVGQIAEGNLTMGALIACSILGGRVIAPVSQSVQYLTQWQSVAQALKMVSAVLNLETERPDGKTLIVPDQVPRRIELEELSFSYPESPIKHLSIPKLTISAGERVAILGPIGSGKSTLLKVIAGLYRPSAGRIRHGLADLWEIDPNAISSYLAYLPQSVHLFKGTLRSNILMAGAVSDSQLLKTCKMLGVDRIASDSPQGMELAITEGGEGVSGGQRQLIGLARLFVAQPKIWLLDEPTSSLDNQTEEQVIAAIEANVGPEDILIISTHRPMLANKLADRVLVMRRGEIVADGTPSDVLNKENNLRQKAQNIARRRGKVNGPSGNC